LCAFAGCASGGLLRLSVPAEQRAEWVTRIRALERELRDRRNGFGGAAMAHLVLLLVGWPGSPVPTHRPARIR